VPRFFDVDKALFSRSLCGRVVEFGSTRRGDTEMNPQLLVNQPRSLARARPSKALDPELARWLAHLDTLIWRPVVYNDRLGRHPDREEDGVLSEVKWSKVKEVISSGNVILTLGDLWGFVLYVSLWSYPASSCKKKPSLLLTITDKHLEGISSGLNAPTEKEGLWGIVKPFTHSRANKAAVKAFLPDYEIKERSAYDY